MTAQVRIHIDHPDKKTAVAAAEKYRKQFREELTGAHIWVYVDGVKSRYYSPCDTPADKAAREAFQQLCLLRYS